MNILMAASCPPITHQALILTVVGEVLKANPSQITVGDAPIQSCDFDELLRRTGAARLGADLRRAIRASKAFTTIMHDLPD